MLNPENLKKLTTQFERVVRQRMEVAKTPGLAVTFTGPEATLWENYFGYANLDRLEALQPTHRFPIGSEGKMFTALAVLQQVEVGWLDLDAPLTTYLPWFKTKNILGTITLHHLLTHTAGLYSGNDFSPSALPQALALQDVPVVFAPGERYHYSDLGYKIIGLALEAVLGIPYPHIIQTHILDPLGMRETHSTVTSRNRPQMATGYTWLYDDRPPHRSFPLIPAAWVEMDTADGCLASTASDMAIFLRMLINRGQGLISPASFDLFVKPHVAMKDEDNLYYGYGIITTTKDGYTRLLHGGNTPGFESFWRLDLDNGLATSVLMNGPLSPDLASFGLQLLRATAGLQEWPELKPLERPARIENAADFVGEYSSQHDKGKSSLRLDASPDQLVLSWSPSIEGQDQEREQTVLEEVFADCFQTPASRFDRFLLTFERHKGRVVEAFWGPDWFINENYSGGTSFDIPTDWVAYTGHYRSFSPWLTNFYIVLRKGNLWLLEADGSDEQMLISTGDSEVVSRSFQIGEGSPEFIRFEMMNGNQTHRANRSGGEYYRTTDLA